eukprot:2434-Pelagococcus_subviridis.AAC.2
MSPLPPKHDFRHPPTICRPYGMYDRQYHTSAHHCTPKNTNIHERRDEPRALEHVLQLIPEPGEEARAPEREDVPERVQDRELSRVEPHQRREERAHDPAEDGDAEPVQALHPRELEAIVELVEEFRLRGGLHADHELHLVHRRLRHRGGGGGGRAVVEQLERLEGRFALGGPSARRRARGDLKCARSSRSTPTGAARRAPLALLVFKQFCKRLRPGRGRHTRARRTTRALRPPRCRIGRRRETATEASIDSMGVRA